MRVCLNFVSSCLVAFRTLPGRWYLQLSDWLSPHYFQYYRSSAV